MPTPSLVLRSSQNGSSTGLGYHPDLPDCRDHVVATKDPRGADFDAFLKGWQAVRGARLGRKNRADAKEGGRNASCDLRKTGYLSPIENQGSTNACTAFATIGAVEFLMRFGAAMSEDVSPAFLYHNTRRLLGWIGDSGAYVRATIKALRLFGVPPDELWQMIPDHIDGQPDAFTYSYAANYRNLKYARIDGYNSGDGATALRRLQRVLAEGIPAVFGFPAYERILDVDGKHPVIPFPSPLKDRLLGGHAVTAVGFDDSVLAPTGEKGAVIIRNSWGAGWGDAGYGYLPYAYFTNQLAVDIWVIYSMDWLDRSVFD